MVLAKKFKLKKDGKLIEIYSQSKYSNKPCKNKTGGSIARQKKKGCTAYKCPRDKQHAFTLVNHIPTISFKTFVHKWGTQNVL